MDPKTHLFYLADAANKQISVIDPRDGNVSAIGAGLFTGIGGCHAYNYDQQGPNGTALFRGRIFAGNGDSHVLGFSLKTGRLVADLDTGGLLRADEMTVAKRDLIVNNPAEKPHPYMSIFSLVRQGYPQLARFVFTHAVGGLEQPKFWNGHLYVSVPQSTQSPAGGEVDELDIANLADIHIIRRFAFAKCQPAGLAIDAHTGLAAVGCGGPHSTSEEILNLRTGQQTQVPHVSGVDIVAVDGPDFLYVSYTMSKFTIADASGDVVQSFPATPSSHTIIVDPSNGNVWVPEDKGDVNLYSVTSPHETSQSALRVVDSSLKW